MSSKQSNLRALLSVFNTRLFVILLETIVVFFVYDFYSINIKVDYTIMSIAIIFPLVFSITSAYQRRHSPKFNGYMQGSISITFRIKSE